MPQITIHREANEDGDMLVVDCKHGTTYVQLFLPEGYPPEGTAALSETAMTLALDVHHQEEPACNCSNQVN